MGMVRERERVSKVGDGGGGVVCYAGDAGEARGGC